MDASPALCYRVSEPVAFFFLLFARDYGIFTRQEIFWVNGFELY